MIKLKKKLKKMKIKKVVWKMMFKQIFPQYEDWHLFSDSIIDSIDEAFDKYIYKILMNHYCTQYIRYSSIDLFKAELSINYTNTYDQHKLQKEYTEKLYKLTPEEVLTVSNIINNQSDNP